MNETQCAVFQGIVYYYRANQVICRYQIALHDPVDLALLQRALDEVRPLSGWYFQKVVWMSFFTALPPRASRCWRQRNSTNKKGVAANVAATPFLVQKEPPDEPPKPSLSVVEPPESLSGWGGS